MKPAVALAIALFAGSFAAAQTGKPDQPAGTATTQSKLMVVVPERSGNCPVSLQARHGVDVSRREVDGGSPQGVFQALHLLVTMTDARRIVEANVTVRGSANKAHVVQVGAATDPAEGAKTMDVHFAPRSGNPKELAADLRVAGLSSADSVELNRITFDDGSTWRLGGANVCRTLVDGLTPVDMR